MSACDPVSHNARKCCLCPHRSVAVMIAVASSGACITSSAVIIIDATSLCASWAGSDATSATTGAAAGATDDAILTRFAQSILGMTSLSNSIFDDLCVDTVRICLAHEPFGVCALGPMIGTVGS